MGWGLRFFVDALGDCLKFLNVPGFPRQSHCHRFAKNFLDNLNFHVTNSMVAWWVEVFPCWLCSLACLLVFIVVVDVTPMLCNSRAKLVPTLSYILLLASLTCDTVDYIFCVTRNWRVDVEVFTSSSALDFPSRGHVGTGNTVDIKTFFDAFNFSFGSGWNFRYFGLHQLVSEGLGSTVGDEWWLREDGGHCWVFFEHYN